MTILKICMCIILTLQLTGCGTLMYPERKGQRAGSIDAGVAVLDGLGLLLFLVPGIIAFAVDFNNGTIYLPGTQRTFLDSHDMEQVKFDPKHTSMQKISEIIEEHTGQMVALDQDGIEVTQLQSIYNLPTKYDNIALLGR